MYDAYDLEPQTTAAQSMDVKTGRGRRTVPAAHKGVPCFKSRFHVWRTGDRVQGSGRRTAWWCEGGEGGFGGRRGFDAAVGVQDVHVAGADPPSSACCKAVTTYRGPTGCEGGSIGAIALCTWERKNRHKSGRK